MDLPVNYVIYEDDQFQLDQLLRELLKESNAKTAILVDQAGFMFAQQGFSQDIDVESLAVLAAGSFASTRELARLVGEEEFSVLFHQGRRDNIHLSLIGEDNILVVIFESTTTIGMVRLCAREAAKKMLPIIGNIKKRSMRKQPDIES
ncbi:MAG: roadblock/LC7 domain-containing protein [Candidatus Zixiibacteriota bacterium]